MENKKDEIIDGMIVILMIIIVGGLSVGGLLRVDLRTISYSDVCEYNYGENYTYGWDRDFGKYCVELVYENQTKVNYKKFKWSNKEIYDMCQVPGFWELDRWDHGICGGENEV